MTKDASQDGQGQAGTGDVVKGSMKARVAVAALLFLLARPTATQAQAPREPDRDSSAAREAAAIEDLDLQTLLNTPVEVWTPSKAPQKSSEAPAIISTVTREQIAIWGYRSVAEVLDHLLGFYVIDDHATPNVAVRGSSGGLYSDSSIIKVLLDGHSVSFAATGGNWLGPELVPLTAIDRIEIIRGPASALYGADAFLGIVHIHTSGGAALSGATAWVTGGRAGKRPAGDIDVAVGSETAEHRLEAVAAVRYTRDDLVGLPLPASSPRPNIPPYNRGAIRSGGLDQATTSALAKVTFRPGTDTILRGFAYYSSMDREAEFGSLFQLAHGYNEAGDFSENRASQWHLRAGADYSQQLAASLKLALRAAYFQGATRDNNRLEVGSDFYWVRRRMRFRGSDVDAHLEWTPQSRLSIATGASLVLDDEQLPARIAVAKRSVQGVERGDVIVASSIYQGRKKFLNAGVYGQGSLRLFDDRLGLTAGLRYDHHNVYGSQLSRRVGVVGSPLSNLHAKLLHGSAFQAPSPFLLYAVPAAVGDVVGNPQLRPQYVNTFEFQLSYQPSWGTTALDFSSAVAYNLLDDKTEFVQQGINRIARNVTRTKTLSWESRAELKFHDWLNAHASFELSRTRLRSGQEGYYGQVIGDEGGVYPRFMLHGGLAMQLGPLPLRAAVLGSWIGTRRASSTNIVLAGRPYDLPSYFRLDATLTSRGFHILRHTDQEVSFSVSGKNLLGLLGPAPGFNGVDYPIAPRAFFAQINFNL